jgi:hypothetical protein
MDRRWKARVEPAGVAASAAEARLDAPARRASIIARVVRRGATISIMLVFVAVFPAVPAQATSGQHWRTLTIHQAWTVTVTGARRVAKQSESLPHTYGPSRPSSVDVQPQSACVRHSPYQIDCPFTYFLGNTSLEVYTQCRDTGQVTEIAEQRFRFTSPKPRCHLIYNKTP